MRRFTAIKLALLALAIIGGSVSTYHLLQSPFRPRYRLGNIQPSDEVPLPYFSPDGRTLVVCEREEHGRTSIRLVDVASGRNRAAFLSHVPVPGNYTLSDSDVPFPYFSPDSRTLAVCDREQNGVISIRLVDVATGHDGMVLTSTLDKISEVAISHDGRYLCVRDGMTDYKLWDTAEGAERALIRGKDCSRVWYVVKNDVGRAYVVHAYAAAHGNIVFSPDSKFVAVALSGFPSVRIVVTATGSELKIMDKPLSASAFAPDAQSIAYTTWDSASGTTRLGIWDVKAGRQSVEKVAHHSPTTCIAFSPDGRMLASSGDAATGKSEVKLWDARTLKERTVLVTASDDDLRSLTMHNQDGFSFSPDGGVLVTRNSSATIIWNVRMQPPQKVVQLGAMIVPIFTRDASLVATAYPYGEVEVWDCARLQRHATIRLPAWATPLHRHFATDSSGPSHQDLLPCTFLAISCTEAAEPTPRGRLKERIAQQLGLSEPNPTVTRLWSTTTGRELGHFPGDGLLSPDGGTLVTVSRSGDITLGDVHLAKWRPDQCIQGLGLSASVLLLISALWCMQKIWSACRRPQEVN